MSPVSFTTSPGSTAFTDFFRATQLGATSTTAEANLAIRGAEAGTVDPVHTASVVTQSSLPNLAIRIKAGRAFLLVKEAYPDIFFRLFDLVSSTPITGMAGVYREDVLIPT